MEDIDSLWTIHESADELKMKLQYMTYELECTRRETDEEIQKNNEQIKKLLQLLQIACKERDEAKSQLKKFQQILALNQKPINISAPFSPDSPLLTNNFPSKPNSSITESSSFSQSLVSSPIVDSISSPDSNNIVFSKPQMIVTQTPTKIVDQESLIIANLANGRPLPSKGNLLQAVLEAGPLLSTLMVAGSLPQWRNPPGVLTHQIPPVNLKLKGCIGASTDTNTNTNTNTQAHMNTSSCVPNGNSTTQMYNRNVPYSNGTLGMCPISMLDFGSGSCLMGGRMSMNNSNVGFDYQIPKRQRIV
ncbi:uncharacterized protein LOC130812881 [Amaranthus tricolor]|uniref:uncharacterized protein LOC130812881 n=1 Tax=Amaranthus tricolor TaxID=29722 RepID=UPI00258C716D|nr:uncharacterized protein LOC130812881 [Amaranthus tricolor]